MSVSLFSICARCKGARNGGYEGLPQSSLNFVNSPKKGFLTTIIQYYFLVPM